MFYFSDHRITQVDAIDVVFEVGEPEIVIRSTVNINQSQMVFS